MAELPCEQRTLVVRTGEEGWGVRASIQDAGPGLDPAIDGRIFDAFFTTKPGGMGMGLSISRSIIEAHGGRFWATPNADHGASFHFTLPALR